MGKEGGGGRVRKAEKNWHQIFHASIFIFPTCHFQYRTHCIDAETRGGTVDCLTLGGA